MRNDLLGLELEHALSLLAREGIEPQVAYTSAPKRREECGGVLRVVDVQDHGAKLTAARFFDPIAEGQQENR